MFVILAWQNLNEKITTAIFAENRIFTKIPYRTGINTLMIVVNIVDVIALFFLLMLQYHQY